MILSLCSLKDTSLSLETQQNSREIERRQHQVEQEHTVLQGQVKNITALFEEIRHRQTETDQRREWKNVYVAQTIM